MPQSLSKVYLHIVFSTKRRNKSIPEKIRHSLQAYIVEVSSNLKSYVHEVYANPDHVHILCELPRTMTISEIVQKIKTSSSIWMKSQGIKNFEWQNGYGVFSASQSKVNVLKKYIQDQPKHHNNVSFEDELRMFYREYQVEFYERYVWD